MTRSSKIRWTAVALALAAGGAFAQGPMAMHGNDHRMGMGMNHGEGGCTAMQGGAGHDSQGHRGHDAAPRGMRGMHGMGDHGMHGQGMHGPRHGSRDDHRDHRPAARNPGATSPTADAAKP